MRHEQARQIRIGINRAMYDLYDGATEPVPDPRATRLERRAYQRYWEGNLDRQQRRLLKNRKPMEWRYRQRVENPIQGSIAVWGADGPPHYLFPRRRHTIPAWEPRHPDACPAYKWGYFGECWDCGQPIWDHTHTYQMDHTTNRIRHVWLPQIEADHRRRAVQNRDAIREAITRTYMPFDHQGENL